MKIRRFRPYFLIVISFLIVITIGTILLALPIASSSGKSFGFVNSLFMATSSVCVTGLSVMDISVEMTIFGKVVMCFLMEIGGLSFITIAVFFFTIFGAKIGVSDRFLLRESLNQNSVKGIVSLVRKIIITSLIIQIIGIIINMFALMSWCDNKFFTALGYSTFHSVASFNNAGFDIFGNDSMIGFKDNILLNSSTMLLIIFGSIGFVVIDDIITNRRWKKLKLHTKITLIITVFLIVFGTLIFKLTLKDATWLQSMFSAITCRTAGFTTYDLSTLGQSPGAYICSIVLMFIGASPCSTGGGIKTTTFAVVILAIISFARGKKTNVFHRRISDSQLFKAFVLITISIAIIITGTFLMVAIQPEIGLEAGLFESVSAFSTTGLSMGVTTSMCYANKIILCLLMFLGRIGPLTVIGLINKNWMNETEKIRYIEESVIIG